MEAPAMPRLVLEVAETKVELPARADDQESPGRDGRGQSSGLSLGKDTGNDLVTGSPQTSRHHAIIEFKHNDFFLIDASTNGTYVQTEDEQVTHVHRNRIRLWGAGWISLGEPLTLGEPIHFRQVDRGAG